MFTASDIALLGSIVHDLDTQRRFHAPLWVSGIGGFAFLIIAWFFYLFYQANHPDWWAPWDEGLPQEMRILNAFVPVAMILLVINLIATALIPSLSVGRRKSTEQKRLLERKQGKPTPAPARLTTARRTVEEKKIMALRVPET